MISYAMIMLSRILSDHQQMRMALALSSYPRPLVLFLLAFYDSETKTEKFHISVCKGNVAENGF